MANDKFPEVEELVLCTVDQIMGTTVFVKLDNYGKTGVIATSEIAPGRIRNLRDYVVPNKKIVCKVLRIDKEKGHIDLSLRRVSQKDKREIIEKFNKERAANTILNLASKKVEEISEKIKKKYNSLFEFLEKARENESIISEFFNKEDSEKISSLIKERIKAKKIEVKKKISVSTIAPNGINIIKGALDRKDVTIIYLGAPFYMVSVEASDYKLANKKLEKALQEICVKIKADGGKVEIIEK
jgi:translation initiation factor 2 subunit 1